MALHCRIQGIHRAHTLILTLTVNAKACCKIQFDEQTKCVRGHRSAAASAAATATAAADAQFVVSVSPGRHWMAKAAVKGAAAAAAPYQSCYHKLFVEMDASRKRTRRCEASKRFSALSYKSLIKNC